MRTKVPQAFQMQFAGFEGQNLVDFHPTDEWDGQIHVTINEHEMTWEVTDADIEKEGGLVLGGITDGSDEIWGDQFWFELRLHDRPPVIRYWGDRVIWREDFLFRD